MGREYLAHEIDVAGFDLTAAGNFDESESLVMVRATAFAAGCGRLESMPALV